MNANSLYLTETELAQRQHRSVRTIQSERIAGGGVPFHKFGRSVRYRLDEVEAWEAAQLHRNTSDQLSQAGERK